VLTRPSNFSDRAFDVVVHPISSRAYTDAGTDSSNSSSYTFSNMNLGTADVDRYIVVGAVVRSGSSSAYANSVSVGGVTATRVQYDRNGASGFLTESSLWIAPLPSGTSADVVLNLNNGAVRAGISVHAVYDIASTTPLATGGDVNSATLNSTVSVPENGIVIAVSYGHSATSASWGDIAEDVELYDREDWLLSKKRVV